MSSVNRLHVQYIKAAVSQNDPGDFNKEGMQLASRGLGWLGRQAATGLEHFGGKLLGSGYRAAKNSLPGMAEGTTRKLMGNQMASWANTLRGFNPVQRSMAYADLAAARAGAPGMMQAAERAMPGPMRSAPSAMRSPSGPGAWTAAPAPPPMTTPPVARTAMQDRMAARSQAWDQQARMPMPGVNVAPANQMAAQGPTGGFGGMMDYMKAKPWWLAGGAAAGGAMMGNSYGKGTGYNDAVNQYRQNTSGFGGTLSELGHAFGITPTQNMFMPKSGSQVPMIPRTMPSAPAGAVDTTRVNYGAASAIPKAWPQDTVTMMNRMAVSDPRMNPAGKLQMAPGGAVRENALTGQQDIFAMAKPDARHAARLRAMHKQSSEIEAFLTSACTSNVETEEMFKQAFMQGVKMLGKSLIGGLAKPWGKVMVGAGESALRSGAQAAESAVARGAENAATAGSRWTSLGNKFQGWGNNILNGGKYVEDANAGRFHNFMNKATTGLGNWDAVGNAHVNSMNGWAGSTARGIRGVGNFVGWGTHPSVAAATVPFAALDGMINRKDWTENGARMGVAQSMAAAQNMNPMQRLAFLFAPGTVAQRGLGQAEQVLPGVTEEYNKLTGGY